MIRGIITDCSVSTDNGRRKFGLVNPTTQLTVPKLEMTLMLDYQMTSKEIEELQHLLGRRISIRQDDKSPRPTKKRNESPNKLTFRG